MGNEGTAGQEAREKVRELVERLGVLLVRADQAKRALPPGSRMRSGLECILADRFLPALEDLIVLSGDLGGASDTADPEENDGASGD